MRLSCALLSGVTSSTLHGSIQQEKSGRAQTPTESPLTAHTPSSQGSPSTPSVSLTAPHTHPLRHLGGPGEDSAKGFYDTRLGFGPAAKALDAKAVSARPPAVTTAAGQPLTPVAKERRPLMKKSLDAAGWQLYQLKLSAREPRKPLVFQYPAGVLSMCFSTLQLCTH